MAMALQNTVPIRTAHEADFPQIMALGRQFYREAWVNAFAWDDESVIATLQDQLAAGILLVSEQNGVITGMIGGVLTPLYYNRRVMVASEMFWWVRPSARGDGFPLLDAFEDEAKARGAGLVAMSLIETMRAAALSRLYERRGYKLVERSFMKAL